MVRSTSAMQALWLRELFPRFCGSHANKCDAARCQWISHSIGAGQSLFTQDLGLASCRCSFLCRGRQATCSTPVRADPGQTGEGTLERVSEMLRCSLRSILNLTVYQCWRFPHACQQLQCHSCPRRHISIQALYPARNIGAEDSKRHGLQLSYTVCGWAELQPRPGVLRQMPTPWEQALAIAFLHCPTLTTWTKSSLLLKSTLYNRPIPGTATAIFP